MNGVVVFPLVKMTALFTNLLMRLHVCDSIKGKFVTCSSVLVYIRDGQSGQLLHSLVVTGSMN